MKNLITLHEAIVLALVSKNDRSGTFEEIADFINDRNLFPVRKAGIPLSKQVMLRSTKSNNKYLYLFEELNKTTIRLRDLKVV